jgi:type I restriction enzyme R subunit
VVLELLDDHTELFKQFSDNANFKRWLADMVFEATYWASHSDETRGKGDIKARALKVVRDRFGAAEVWSKAVDTLLNGLRESGCGSLSISDLGGIGESSGLSVSHILLPVVNLLSANDVGILHREFFCPNASGARCTMDFDEVRRMASENLGEKGDWAEQLSIRWELQDARGCAHGR